ncbi:hypothetical protein Peur_013965 [Populus x canadensis]
MGEHDFRNLCKTDAVNVQNCRRHVTSFEISPCDLRFKGHQLCALKIKGSAFLLHQVCCMVAVLLMIGQGLESPDNIISEQDEHPQGGPFALLCSCSEQSTVIYAGGDHSEATFSICWYAFTTLRKFLKFHPFTWEILKARQVNRCITGHSKDTKETPVSHGSRNSIGSSSCEFEGLKFACSSNKDSSSNGVVR